MVRSTEVILSFSFRTRVYEDDYIHVTIEAEFKPDESI
jgi:hypothetical protein